MVKPLIYPIGSTQACRYAAEYLYKEGFPLVDHPTPEATHLLLDAPAFDNDGLLKSGQSLERILEMLPQYITVIGGNLDHPCLENHKCMDLLKDETYLAANAAITAECALQVAAPLLSRTFSDSSVLVIGWGRIGKCLGKLLKDLGADVTVAARKDADRAMLRALGYDAANPGNLKGDFQLIFNTAPAPISGTEQFQNCVKIDLASKRGLTGGNVVWARGLPGIHAPESSGRLIAKTVSKRIREG